MSSEPPEEPHLRSEPSPLSPASPKPIHFPAPTNIPVLEMQMDVGFNQTEAHMNDPAMHNTDIRPDVWRDPKEMETLTAPVAQIDQPSLQTTGEEASQAGQEGASNVALLAATSGDNVTDSNIDAAMDHDQIHNPSLSASSIANVTDPAQAAQQVTSSDPSVPNADGKAPSQDVLLANLDQSGGDPQVPSFSDSANVQALWDSLNPTPVANAYDQSSNGQAIPSTDGPAALVPSSTTQDPSEAQQNGGHAGVDEASSSGLGLAPSGLPPRPPPQEQPLIHPNYVHSQHIRDYHPHASNPAFQPHVRTGSQGNIADPNSKSHVPPVHSLPGGVGSSETESSAYPTNLATSTNGQPAPGVGMPYTPTASSMQNAGYAASPQNMYGTSYPSNISTPIESRRERTLREGEQPRPEDRPWDAEVQEKYDRFIEEERRYVSEGKWEQFPQGSRLFVGKYSCPV